MTRPCVSRWCAGNLPLAEMVLWRANELSADIVALASEVERWHIVWQRRRAYARRRKAER